MTSGIHDKYVIANCVACPRDLYWRHYPGKKDDEFCPRCKALLHRKRPVLYERASDIAYMTKKEASEWLWDIPMYTINRMLDYGTKAEVYDEDTGRVIGVYTLERWLPHRIRTQSKRLSNLNEIESLIKSGKLERKKAHGNSKRSKRIRNK